MPTPFPGMDPYLERSGLWSQVHTGLIVDIQRALTALLRPKYQVVIEQRTYVSLLGADNLVGEPDVLVIASGSSGAAAIVPTSTTASNPVAGANGAYMIELPMPEEIRERWLEVRDRVTGQAITFIEILSPSNKMSDRERYERKRLKVLASSTNLVEIDLLSAGPHAHTGRTPSQLLSHHHQPLDRASAGAGAALWPAQPHTRCPHSPTAR